MANPAIQAVIDQLVEWTEQYRADYSAATDKANSPKRATWEAEIEKRLDDVDDEYLGDVERNTRALIDLAQGTEDPAEVLSVLNAVNEVLSKIKLYLGTLFTSEVVGRKAGAGLTVAEMIERHDMIVSTFKGVLGMIPAGFTSTEELESLGLGRWTDGREMTRNGVKSKSDPLFVADLPGRFKDPDKVGRGTKGPQVRSNSVKVRLLVDGIEPEGRILGDQCRNSGIPGLEWRECVRAFEAANVPYLDPRNLGPNLLEYKGKMLGLKMADEK